MHNSVYERNAVAKKNPSELTTEELQQELYRRAEIARKRAVKRDRLLEQITQIDEELGVLGYEAETPAPTNGLCARGGSQRRPRNDQPLPKVLHSVMRGKTMGVTEAAEAARKAGYRSSSASFRNIVNQTLLKHPNLFKKVERGQYTTK